VAAGPCVNERSNCKIGRYKQTLMTLSVNQGVTWMPYENLYGVEDGHYVSGTVLLARDVHSPRLNNDREIYVYLPPSYDATKKRYPVLYMHDGQNLFDNALSFAGKWGVDEVMEQLAREEGLEAIVVGIPNMGKQRLDEYSPFHDPHHGGGKGTMYIGFLTHTLKPLIDASFRTLTDPQHTGIMGSSMGGLISLYGYFHREYIFGFAGVMSPSLWFGQAAMFDFVLNAPYVPGKIYLDVGTREEGGSLRAMRRLARSRRTYGHVRRMKRILVQKGYRLRHQLWYVEEKWAGHNEAAWRRRLPVALRFFLTEASEE